MRIKARKSIFDFRIFLGFFKNLKENVKQMKEETNGMKEQMKETRDEMRRVGQCLQAGKRAMPSAATNKLKGSAPAGEDRAIRETCRVTEKVKETVTREKLDGVTETCTRETGRQVTELTKAREAEERLHGTDGGGLEMHTHTRTHTYR